MGNVSDVPNTSSNFNYTLIYWLHYLKFNISFINPNNNVKSFNSIFSPVFPGKSYKTFKNVWITATFHIYMYTYTCTCIRLISISFDVHCIIKTSRWRFQWKQLIKETDPLPYMEYTSNQFYFDVNFNINIIKIN